MVGIGLNQSNLTKLVNFKPVRAKLTITQKIKCEGKEKKEVEMEKMNETKENDTSK